MNTNYILSDNSITIKNEVDKGKIFMYYLYLFLIICAVSSLYFLHKFGLHFITLLVYLAIHAYVEFSKNPGKISDVTITKFNDYITINKKKILFEKILFLSFKEQDGFRIIRLECIRKNILIANDFILFDDCNNAIDALEKCKMLQQFIGSGIKINHITIDNSSTYNESNSKGEKWNFV
jgi:hypothetical protein